MDQQAAGGEDPNKPSKKKSNEDESKNKKLVGLQNSVCCCYFLVLSHKVCEILSLGRSFHNMDATIRFFFFSRFLSGFLILKWTKVHVNKNKVSLFLLMLYENCL